MIRLNQRLVVLGLIGFLAVGCGGDDDDANQENGQQNADEQTENQDPNAGNNGEVPACEDLANIEIPEDDPDMTDAPDYDQNYDMIFNEFAFNDDSPGKELNPIIENFLDQEDDFPIIVLVELTEVDAATGDLTIRGGAGLHAGDPGGGEYIWDTSEGIEEPDSASGTIDGSGQLYAGLPLLNFVATVETEEDTLKTIIPIRDILLDAQVDVAGDGSAPTIEEGALDGVIVLEDIEDVRIAISPGAEGFPLPQILDEDKMNCDYSGDGEANAWALAAMFNAEQTVIVEE